MRARRLKQGSWFFLDKCFDTGIAAQGHEPLRCRPTTANCEVPRNATNLHYYGMDGIGPEQSHSTCAAVVSNTTRLHELFVEGLRVCDTAGSRAPVSCGSLGRRSGRTMQARAASPPTTVGQRPDLVGLVALSVSLQRLA